jgi:hypothetical protein
MAPKMIGNLRQIPGAATAISPIRTVSSPIEASNWLSLTDLNGHGREIETNGCNHRASHHGRHQSFNPANARLHDDQSDDAVQHTRCNDATQRNIEVWVWPMAGITACSYRRRVYWRRRPHPNC